MPIPAAASRPWTRRRPKTCSSRPKSLAFRDFLTVALVVPEDDGFPDNWIYIHAPDVEVGRVQNFGSWSPEMIPEDGQDLPRSRVLRQRGRRALDRGRRRPRSPRARGRDGDARPARRPAGSRRATSSGCRRPIRCTTRPTRTTSTSCAAGSRRDAPNVHPVGRNGMHRYNNQDHSMYTAMLTVENIVEGTAHDVWEVNVEDEYHEEISESDG